MSLILVADRAPLSIKRELFQKTILTYIKIYCSEIVMSYANLLNEVQENDQPAAEEDENVKRVRVKKLDASNHHLKRLEDPLFNAFISVSQAFRNQFEQFTDNVAAKSQAGKLGVQ
jgi:hypothetical protein